MRIPVALLMALACLSGREACAANLVVNGGFESPIVTFPYQHFSTGSSSISGWTVVNDTVSVLRIGCCDPADPSEGSQYLDLTGPNDGQSRYGGVSQTITTVPGLEYELTFDLGNYAQNPTSFNGGRVGIVASAGGTSQTFHLGPVTTGSIWEGEVLTFVATATSTQIVLTGLDGAQYVGLDNVVVQAVPEPSAILLMSIGFVGLGAATLRRRRQG